MSRRWRLVGLPLLWLAVLASAVAAVRARHESRALFVELERLSAERDALNIAWGQDQLEQSSWSNPAIVERVAADKRHMVFPKPNEVEIVAQ
jgi:cell division protein FtsL